MTGRYNGLPVCEHIRLGVDLLHMREALIVRHGNTLQSGYRKSSKVHRDLRRAVDAIDQLRCELDSQSAAEHTISTWAPNIYYGANADRWRAIVLPIWDKHQAEQPDCVCAGQRPPAR